MHPLFAMCLLLNSSQHQSEHNFIIYPLINTSLYRIKHNQSQRAMGEVEMKTTSGEISTSHGEAATSQGRTTTARSACRTLGAICGVTCLSLGSMLVSLGSLALFGWEIARWFI